MNKEIINNTIVLYGAGELGKLSSEFFDFYKIDYIVCDDNPENYKNDKYWKLKIYSPDFLFDDIKKNSLILVCISIASYNIIRDKLIEKGFTDIKPFFQVAEEINKANGYKHPLTNGWKHSYTIENKKIKPIMREFIFDFKSYHAYLSFFIWHKLYQEYYAGTTNCNDRYFIPEVINVLHDHETFIDIGAYDGRVSLNFKQIVNNKYDEIRCFEPDFYNYALMSNNFYEKGLNWSDNILVYKEVLGNKKGNIGFKNGFNYLSKVNKKSRKKITIKKLDNYIDDYNSFTPTCIKIHVEGYELGVLKGSIKTIKKYRPIIAVTTYHNEDGLYKIPLWLIKNCKDYNFYWRNHNYQGQGAVMYCIPKERGK